MVHATDPSVQFDLPVTSLRAEREKGAIMFHNAITKGQAMELHAWHWFSRRSGMRLFLWQQD
ncbi:MAG: hypothetical protein P8Y58_09055 [Novosphingobium sp.]